MVVTAEIGSFKPAMEVFWRTRLQDDIELPTTIFTNGG
jgi:hypothetical protein